MKLTKENNKQEIMKPPNLKDTSNLSRYPVGEWFAAGAYPIHPSATARLYRLGLLKRRPVHDMKLSRTWDYFRER